MALFFTESHGSWFEQKTPEVLKKYSVQSGDTIYSLLKRFYFSQEQIQQILKSGPSFSENYSLHPKQAFWVSVNEKSKETKVRFFHPLKDEALVFWRNPKSSGYRLNKVDYDKKVKTIRGQIKGSTVVSIQNYLPDEGLAYRFLDAYKLEYNLKKEVQRGAPFDMTYEEKHLHGQFIKYGEILKTSLVLREKKESRYFIASHKGGGSFVNPNDLMEDRPLYSPVKYLRITSDFQPRRFHPIKKRRVAHLGVDFELPTGDPVFAVLSGRIEKRGRNRAAGNYIAIKHSNGLTSYYNHLYAVESVLKVL